MLTEPYFECTSTFYEALNNAIGIASGNTSTFFPIFVAMLLPLMYLYLKIIGYVPPKEEYTKEEKEEALDILLTNILRVRDGKTRAMPKHGPFVNLANDLVKISTEAPGYPDSDDSDDEDPDSDDEEPNKNNKNKRNKSTKSQFNIEAGSGDNPSSSSAPPTSTPRNRILGRNIHNPMTQQQTIQ